MDSSHCLVRWLEEHFSLTKIIVERVGHQEQQQQQMNPNQPPIDIQNLVDEWNNEVNPYFSLLILNHTVESKIPF